MKFLLDGGLGDNVAATAVVREFRRVFPDEMVRLEGVYHKPVWENNPNLRWGKTENGLTATLGLHMYENLGSIPHAFAKQTSLALGRDFQIVNDTPEIWLTREEREAAGARLLKAVPDRRKVKVALVDSNAMWPSRRYPGVHFAEVVQLLRQRGWITIQIGSSGLDSYGNAPEPVGCDIDWRDQTGVRASSALMYQADVFVGNDSGGFHMAAAVGCPTAVAFGVKKWYSRGYWNTVPVFSYDPCLPACFDLCDRTGGHRGIHCLATIPAWRYAEAVEWAYTRFGRW